jgi:hypothetical protein
MTIHVKEQHAVRFAVRLTATEASFLAALAEADGLSVSDALRLSIRRQHEARFGVAAPKPAKKGKR